MGLDSGCYSFNCVCGAKIISANPVGTCFDCKRRFEVDWNGKYIPPSDPKTISEKYD